MELWEKIKLLRQTLFPQIVQMMFTQNTFLSPIIAGLPAKNSAQLRRQAGGHPGTDYDSVINVRTCRNGVPGGGGGYVPGMSAA